MLDFVCAEYKEGKARANEKLKQRIVEIGIRKTARATKLDSKTIMLISRGEPVKAGTLAQVARFLEANK